MGYDLKMRVWRGDEDGGELVDYTVEVEEGEVVLDAIRSVAGNAGRRPRRPMELQGRKVWLVQRRDQWPPATSLHDPPVDLRTGRDDHGDADAHVPGAARPRHRRLFNYEKAKQVPAFTPPADLKPGDYRMQQVDVERSRNSVSASSVLVPKHLPRRARP